MQKISEFTWPDQKKYLIFLTFLIYSPTNGLVIV